MPRPTPLRSGMSWRSTACAGVAAGADRGLLPRRRAARRAEAGRAAAVVAPARGGAGRGAHHRGGGVRPRCREGYSTPAAGSAGSWPRRDRRYLSGCPLPPRVRRSATRRWAGDAARSGGHARATAWLGTSGLAPARHRLPALDEFPWRDWARIGAGVPRPSGCGARLRRSAGAARTACAITDYLGQRVASSASRIRSWSCPDRSRASTSPRASSPHRARVWFEEPGYGAARAALRASRCASCSCPRTATASTWRGHRHRAVRAARRRDAVVSLSTRRHDEPGAPPRAAGVGRRDRRVVLEDDYYGEYRFAGRPQSPLYALDRLRTGAVSRHLQQDARAGPAHGFVVAPRPWCAPHALKIATDRYTPGLMQLVLARFIAEGRLARTSVACEGCTANVATRCCTR